MEKELIHRLGTTDWPNLDSVYFGGGTPSILSEHEIRRFLEIIAKHYSLQDAEITLEANPDDLTHEKLQQLSQAGINRLSVGIQSFFEEDLTWMNRSHNAEQALSCLKLATDTGFRDISADLIFGYPLLSDEKWQHNLDTLLSFPINHLSAYSMTVEAGTALDHFIRNRKTLPMSEGQAERQYRWLLSELEKRGWDHYEISNFSLPGHPSRHNSAYWKGKPYLGIGPSAHGYDGNTRYWNLANNPGYIRAMESGEIPEEKEVLSDADRHNEYLLTRLRTRAGLDREEFGLEFGDRLLQRLDSLMQQESLRPYFDIHKKSLRLNREGFLLADHLIGGLFLDQ